MRFFKSLFTVLPLLLVPVDAGPIAGNTELSGLASSLVSQARAIPDGNAIVKSDATNLNTILAAPSVDLDAAIYLTNRLIEAIPTDKTGYDAVKSTAQNLLSKLNSIKSSSGPGAAVQPTDPLPPLAGLNPSQTSSQTSPTGPSSSPGASPTDAMSSTASSPSAVITTSTSSSMDMGMSMSMPMPMESSTPTSVSYSFFSATDVPSGTDLALATPGSTSSIVSSSDIVTASFNSSPFLVFIALAVSPLLL